MKAKIRDVGFSLDKIIVGVDVYLEAGEGSYDDFWADIPNYPSVEGQPEPPTHREQVPFKSIAVSLPTGVTEENALQAVRNKLEAFKKAYSKAASAQDWVGQEFSL